VVSQVHPIYTRNVSARLLGAEQGQAVAEYAMILAAIIGLLAFVTGFGLATSRVINWIVANMF